jgi:hypothetical protein
MMPLRNDAYPELEFDEIDDVQWRSLISPDRAIVILRQYLKTGEPTDMVPWPSPDEAEWDGDLPPDRFDDKTGPSPPVDIPF